MNIGETIAHFLSIVDFSNTANWHNHLTMSSLFLAQTFENVDILANLQNAWQEFLHSGKAGALVVGLIMGYVIRGLTKS
jgi:hypothetical protein